MVLGGKTISPRTKMVLGRKTNFFLSKKNGFGVKNQFFLGKNGFGQKNQLFPKKKWFWAGKPIFSYRKPKKTIFVNFGRIVSKKCVFLVLQKLVFLAKTIFSPGKKWFFTPKPFFPRRKLVFLPKTIFFLGKTKNTIFLECGRIVSQFFLVFPRKVGFGLGVHSVAVDYVLTSNLNELTDSFCWDVRLISVVLERYRIRTSRRT